MTMCDSLLKGCLRSLIAGSRKKYKKIRYNTDKIETQQETLIKWGTETHFHTMPHAVKGRCWFTIQFMLPSNFLVLFPKDSTQ